MNKEQIAKQIKNALHKWEPWSSFTVTKKGHGFEIEFVYTGPKNVMSLEDVVIWKYGVKQVKPKLPPRSASEEEKR